MPRIPRKLLLVEGYQTHKIWRGHNKEWNLGSSDEKNKYLELLNISLPKQSNELNAYCNMSNHSHEQYDIKNVTEFSNLMRDHHSRYGSYFNKKHNRQGKVAYERPKTCLIQSDQYSMQTTLYIHSNPVRAGITKNASNYRWSTHRLYAYGKRDKYTQNVVFPNWYLNLGNTSKDRQRRYRRLFDAYLKDQGLIKQPSYSNNFLGDFFWCEDLKEKIKYWIKSRSTSPPTSQISTY